HEIPALGHDEGKWTVVRDADCTHEGLEERRCTRCGELLESRTIGAKGHSYGDWIVVKEPTTSSEGLKTRTCSICGDTETVVIPKLQKKNNAGVIAVSCVGGIAILGCSILIPLLIKKKKKKIDK
ncbi:MAG: hypothetical protein MR464_04990, partial [Bacilli bacterium]|nr:hypothetical protein [Bacilli bacterium]